MISCRSAGSIFTKTMDAFADTMGKRAFRPDRALNAAVFDSMSVGLARRIVSSGRAPSPEQMNEAHSDLLEDEEYFEAVSSRTSHDLLREDAHEESHRSLCGFVRCGIENFRDR